MNWYDFLSLFYDRALEEHYKRPREMVVRELDTTAGSLVLDVACGTGQNFPLIKEHLKDGVIVGIDSSRGMLRKARRRIEASGWSEVHLIHSGLSDVNESDVQTLTGRSGVDQVICTLGLTVIKDWKSVLTHAMRLLKPGGRIVLFDAFIEEPVHRTRISRILARADLSRRFWEPLEHHALQFRLVQLPGEPEDYGGRLYLATGLKPRS